jgi:hypothetical protein
LARRGASRQLARDSLGACTHGRHSLKVVADHGRRSFGGPARAPASTLNSPERSVATWGPHAKHGKICGYGGLARETHGQLEARTQLKLPSPPRRCAHGDGGPNSSRATEAENRTNPSSSLSAL